MLVLLLYIGVQCLCADAGFIAGRSGLPVPPLAFAPWGVFLVFVGDHPWLTALWSERGG